MNYKMNLQQDFIKTSIFIKKQQTSGTMDRLHLHTVPG